MPAARARAVSAHSLGLTTCHTTLSLSLDAIRDAVTPVLKHDESNHCGSFDDVETIEPSDCANEPYKSEALYCTCSATAGSPDEVFIEWSGLDEVRVCGRCGLGGGVVLTIFRPFFFQSNAPITVNLTQKDLCESSAVPETLKPSKVRIVDNVTVSEEFIQSLTPSPQPLLFTWQHASLPASDADMYSSDLYIETRTTTLDDLV